MIERLCEQIIQELGATGLLVVGLYFFLYRPLGTMAKHLEQINNELGELIAIVKNSRVIKNGEIERTSIKS